VAHDLAFHHVDHVPGDVRGVIAHTLQVAGHQHVPEVAVHALGILPVAHGKLIVFSSGCHGFLTNGSRNGPKIELWIVTPARENR